MAKRPDFVVLDVVIVLMVIICLVGFFTALKG